MFDSSYVYCLAKTNTMESIRLASKIIIVVHLHLLCRSGNDINRSWKCSLFFIFSLWCHILPYKTNTFGGWCGTPWITKRNNECLIARYVFAAYKRMPFSVDPALKSTYVTLPCLNENILILIEFTVTLWWSPVLHVSF